MASAASSPTTSLEAFVCPHCHVYAHQRWAWLWLDIFNGAPDAPSKMSGGGGTVSPKSSSSAVNVQSIKDLTAIVADRDRVKVVKGGASKSVGERLDNVYTSVCAHCQQPSLWVSRVVVWPPSSSAPAPATDMPEALRNDYLEAAGIAGRSPRGAAALLRLVIQKLCGELLGNDAANLNSAIQKLVEQGLPLELQEALDIVRVVGNEAVHPGQMDISDDPQIVDRLFELVNLVVEQTITRRKTIAAMMAKLPSGARDSINSRGPRKPPS